MSNLLIYILTSFDGMPDLMRDWWGVGGLLVMTTPAMMVALAMPVSRLVMVSAMIIRVFRD